MTGDTTSDNNDDGWLRRVRHSALRAGPLYEPLQVLSDEELAQPIEPEDADVISLQHDSCEEPLPAATGYHARRLLSRGGQAGVYEAVQVATGRRVALKVFHGGRFLHRDSRRRLEREVEALATVDHPGIIGIIDCGRTLDGAFFLATQYVEGQTLDQHVAALRSSGDFKAILRLFIKIADALRTTHNAGIVHRDLKPSNILVDREGNPHVIDFGLARLMDPERRSESSPTVTATGQILGSLPWASPEQADGDSSKLGLASDCYTLGVLIFKSLTGDFPYRVDGTISEVIQSIRSRSPDTLGAGGRQFGGVPIRPLQAVLSKAMAKSPADRYPSAKELKEDLERVLNGERTEAASLGRQRSRRRYTKWLLLSLIAAAVVVALAWERPVRFATPMIMPTYETKIGLRMIRLNEAFFDMGSPATEDGRNKFERRHREEIPARFWIAATEVTRGQFRRVMDGVEAIDLGADANLPVIEVSQEQAMEFCRRLSLLEGATFRLPDEREWEYACRANSPGPYAGTGELDSMGWHAGNSGNRVHAVGLKSPNAWGLYDMHGNVREWCRDGFVEGYERNPDHPQAGYNPVVKGGGWRSPADECRSAFRGSWIGSVGASDLGFRVVMEDVLEP